MAFPKIDFSKHLVSQDLTNYSIAFANAIAAGIMSREQARATWKRLLVESGIVNPPPKPASAGKGKTTTKVKPAPKGK